MESSKASRYSKIGSQIEEKRRALGVATCSSCDRSRIAKIRRMRLCEAVAPSRFIWLLVSSFYLISLNHRRALMNETNCHQLPFQPTTFPDRAGGWAWLVAAELTAARNDTSVGIGRNQIQLADAPGRSHIKTYISSKCYI